MLITVTDMTLADVKLELAREEAANAQSGIQHAHEVTASRFLTMGLDLEEQQYVFCQDLYDHSL